MRQVLDLQPMEVHGGADLHLQPLEDPMLKQVGGWRRLWAPGEPMLEQAPSRTCGPVGDPHGKNAACGKDPCWARVPEGLHPVGRTHAGAVCGRLSPVGGTPGWSRGRVWGVLPLRRKEQQRQRVMNWPQPPFPVPLYCCWGEGREFGSEVEPVEKEGVGGRCF